MKWNCYGLRIKDAYIVSDGKYLLSDETVDWTSFAQYSDENGFDIRNGVRGIYKKKIILPKGTEIFRYGMPGGRYTAPMGEVYEDLSLPYLKETMPYHEYIVTERLRVICIVERGVVAPNFNSTGGAIQYLHERPIEEELANGVLKESYRWLIRAKIISYFHNQI